MSNGSQESFEIDGHSLAHNDGYWDWRLKNNDQ